jgi:hypothetical protein
MWCWEKKYLNNFVVGTDIGNCNVNVSAVPINIKNNWKSNFIVRKFWNELVDEPETKGIHFLPPIFGEQKC